VHILNALGGLSPPTSKPLISATTRNKLSSIATIDRFKYINADLPIGASGSPFELFGELDDHAGESDEEHELLLPHEIGGITTPQAHMFFHALKRKLGDVTPQEAVPEKKVAAEVAGSCQEDETAAAHPTPRDPEPPLVSVSPIPAAAPVAEEYDDLAFLSEFLEEELSSAAPPVVAIADVDNVFAEVERVDDFLGDEFFENLQNLGNVENRGAIELIDLCVFD
jgi:hypothetical protein